MLLGAGLVVFSSAYFEFADEVPQDVQHGSLRTFCRVFQPSSRPFEGCWCEVLRVGSPSPPLCCHAAFISASTPGSAHEPCAPRGRLKRDAGSAAVESMTSAMSVTMSVMQVPSGIGGSAATIAFASWHRGSDQPPEVGRLRSFLGTVPLSPIWCGPTWDADFRVYEIVIRFCCL